MYIRKLLNKILINVGRICATKISCMVGFFSQNWSWKTGSCIWRGAADWKYVCNSILYFLKQFLRFYYEYYILKKIIVIQHKVSLFFITLRRTLLYIINTFIYYFNCQFFIPKKKFIVPQHNFLKTHIPNFRVKHKSGGK